MHFVCEARGMVLVRSQERMHIAVTPLALRVQEGTGALHGARLVSCQPSTPIMAALAIFLYLSLACSAAAAPYSMQQALSDISTNPPEFGWYDPRTHGGRFLDVRLQIYSLHCILISGSQYTTDIYGEPLNVIISGLSDPFILTDYGFAYYTK